MFYYIITNINLQKKIYKINIEEYEKIINDIEEKKLEPVQNYILYIL